MRAATLYWIVWGALVVVSFLAYELPALWAGAVKDTATWHLVVIMRTHPFWAAAVPTFFLALGALIAIHLVIEYFRLP